MNDTVGKTKCLKAETVFKNLFIVTEQCYYSQIDFSCINLLNFHSLNFKLRL